MAAYNLIATTTVGSGGAASIAFSSIPQTYTDLKLVVSARNTVAANIILASFNGSTADFTARILSGNGSSASSSVPTSRAVAFLQLNTDTASVFSNSEIYIPNYSGSTFKSFSSDSVRENNATGATLVLLAGLWSNTAAISSIALTLTDSGNFMQYSSASLYGIKNS